MEFSEYKKDCKDKSESKPTVVYEESGQLNRVSRMRSDCHLSGGHCLKNSCPKIQEIERNKIQERMADLCHRQWGGWMEYLFSKCIEYKPDSVQASEGSVIIPKWAVERWKRQILTAYKDLPEEEKETDRAEADKFLRILEYSIPAQNSIKKIEEELVQAKKAIATLQTNYDRVIKVLGK